MKVLEPINSNLRGQNMKKNDVRRIGADFRRFQIDSGMLEKDRHRSESTCFQSKLTLLEKIENSIFRIFTRASSPAIRADLPVN